MLPKDRIVVLPMTKNDIMQVAEIEKECFSMPWSVQAFELELEKTDAVTLVAHCESKVVGFVNVNIVLDEMYLNNIAVTSSYRGAGIGGILLKSLEEIARMRVSFITLEVRASNEAAKSLYQRSGFEIVGRRKNFYEKPLEDAILMTKHL